MRDSSTTCTVTFQPLSSSDSSPRIVSIGRPSNSGSSSRARSMASRPFIDLPRPLLRFPARRASAIVSLLTEGEAFEEGVLALAALVLPDRPVLVFEFQRHQLTTNRVLVVELALELFGDLFGHPEHAPNGRERKGEKSR